MTVSAKQSNEQHYSIVFNLWARITHASTISTHIGHNMETKSEIVDDHLNMVYIFTQLLIYLIFLVYTSNSTYSKTHFSRCYLLRSVCTLNLKNFLWISFWFHFYRQHLKSIWEHQSLLLTGDIRGSVIFLHSINHKISTLYAFKTK